MKTNEKAITKTIEVWLGGARFEIQQKPEAPAMLWNCCLGPDPEDMNVAHQVG